jgi:hypothetical protein
LARAKTLIDDELAMCKKWIPKGVNGYSYLVRCENIKKGRLDHLRTRYQTLDEWQPLLCELNPKDPTHEKYRLTKERQVKLDNLESDRVSCNGERTLLSLITDTAVESCDAEYDVRKEKVLQEYRSRLE